MMIRKVLVSAALLGIVLTFSACSLRDPSQTRMITIQVPETKASSLKSIANDLQMPFLQYTSDLQPVSRMPRPVSYYVAGPSATQWSDLTCFAVSVNGPGITPNANVACPPGTTPPGLVAGMIGPGQTLNVAVPDGPSRLIQLMGFDTLPSVGCPDLPTKLQNSSNGNDFNGIDGPYNLGQATVDVFSDVSVTINATFDVNQKLYNNCGVGNQGPTLPPTAGYGGYYSEANNSGPLETLKATTPPSSTVGAPDLTGATSTFNSGTLAALPTDSRNGGSLPLTSGISFLTPSGSPLRRSAIQFQWGLAGVDLATYPYGKFKLEMRGGQADSCATQQIYNTAVGVWNNTTGKWMALGTSQSLPTVGPQWWWAGNPISVPLSQLAITKSDGNKYLILNVESNFASTASCQSGVDVAIAGLQLYKTVAAQQDNSGSPLQIGSNVLQGTAGNQYTVYYGENASFFGMGGTPPYTFSAAAPGTIDSNGNWTAPSSGTSTTVTVTDATGAASTATINLINLATTPVAGAIALGTSTGAPVTAGTCMGLTFAPVAFDGTPSTVGVAISITGITVSSGSTWNTAGCTGAPATSTTIAANGSVSSPTVYYQPTQAGNASVSFTVVGVTNYLGAEGLSFGVTPQAYTGTGKVSIAGPSVVSSGYCAAYQVLTEDQYGNPVAPLASDAPGGIVVNLSGVTTGAFFSNSTCTTPTTSVTIPSASANAPVYFSWTTAGPVAAGSWTGVTASATGGSPAAPGFLAPPPGITIEPAGTPVAYKLTQIGTVDAAGCVQLQLNTVDSYGTPQNVTGGNATPSIYNSYNPPNVFTSAVNCDGNTGVVGTATITNGTNQQMIWVRAYHGNNIQTSGTSTPSPLMPARQISIQ